MLRTRVLTAIVLIVFLLIIILFSSPFIFACISAGVMACAAAEWCKLAGFKTAWGRVLAFISMPIILFSFFAILHALGISHISNLEAIKTDIAYFVLGFWILASVGLAIYPKGRIFYQSKHFNLLIGLFILVPTWASVFALFSVSTTWLLYPIVLVCLADTAAYFAGRKWGKHKLAPLISPSKTWEGVMGAMLCTLIVAVISYFMFEIRTAFLPWALLNVITVLFSIVGDLFESLFKRQQHLKDSGVLLPGHGGILDRIDSMTAALPIFTIGLMLFL